MVVFLRNYFYKYQRRALLAAMLTLIVFLVVWFWVGGLLREKLLSDSRLQIAAEITPYGNALTTAVIRRFALLEGLGAFILHEIPSPNEIASEEFDDFAAGLQIGASGVRNISIAPGGIQKFVYPLEGNENVPGHDLINDERPNVRADVQRTIESQQIVLSGPYELRQGGLGVVARKAIYLEDEFWGLAAMVLDIPPILLEAGIDPVPEGLMIALVKEDGEIFFGTESVVEQDPVQYEIPLPEGTWQLLGTPQFGWGASHIVQLRIAKIGSLVIIFLISFLVYLSVYRRERLTHQVEKRSQALAESENLLREVIDNMGKAIAIYEPIDGGQDFEFVSMNKFGEGITHFKIEEVVGKTVRELFPGEPTVGLIAKLRETWETGKPTTIPLKQYQDNRIIQWVENYIFKLPSGRVVAMFEDTFEKRSAEMALAESENRLDTFLKNSPDTIYMLDLENKSTAYFNKNEFVGYSIDELSRGQSILDAVHPEDKEKVNTHWNALSQSPSKEILPIDYRVKSKAGDWVWINQRTNVLPQSEGKSGRQVLITLSDITRRKDTEAALKQLNEELEERVTERTERLQILVNAMAGREIRMAELKKVIKKLRQQLIAAGLAPAANDPLAQDDL